MPNESKDAIEICAIRRVSQYRRVPLPAISRGSIESDSAITRDGMGMRSKAHMPASAADDRLRNSIFRRVAAQSLQSVACILPADHRREVGFAKSGGSWRHCASVLGSAPPLDRRSGAGYVIHSPRAAPVTPRSRS